VCAACLDRTTTGTGAFLDIAMADVVATWTGAVGPRLDGTEGPTRAVPGYGTFATTDGYVALGVLDEDPFWSALCHALGLDDHAGLVFAERAARTEELQAALAAAVVRRSRDELVAVLVDAGVPAAPVLDRPGMLALDHFRERGTFTADFWSVVNRRGPDPRGK